MPEVELTETVLQAIETAKRIKMLAGRSNGRVNRKQLSLEDKEAYARASKLLMYHVDAKRTSRLRRERKAVESAARAQAVLQDLMRTDVPAWVRNLSPGTVANLKRIAQHGTFDQRLLTIEEKQVLAAAGVSKRAKPRKAAKTALSSSPGGASSSRNAKRSQKASASFTGAEMIEPSAPAVLPVVSEHGLTTASAQPAATEVTPAPLAEIHTVSPSSAAPPSHLSPPPAEPSLMLSTSANPGLPSTPPDDSPLPYHWRSSFDGPIRSPDGLYPY